MTVTEDIIDTLGQQIVDGKIKPGERLPNERELAENYQVTRGRIREALRGLAMSGLIEIKRGNGSFVRHPDDWIDSLTVKWAFAHPYSSNEDLIDVRDVLEKGVYQLAFDRCNNIDLEKIEKRLLSLREVYGDDELNFTHALDAFDLELAKIARNHYFLRLFQVLLLLRRASVIEIVTNSNNRRLSLTLRESLYEAFKCRDKQQALTAIDAFFSKAREFSWESSHITL